MADFGTLKQAIIDGESGAVALTESLISEGIGAREILDSALLPGMDVVGERMKSGEMFIPEVLFSAQIMQSCLDVLKPLLGDNDADSKGVVVLGTVEGDVHDIGKDLVGLMLSAAGFEVVNLGTDINPEQFVAAVGEHKPRVIGMSGMLTTTIPGMARTIAALKDAGLRESVQVIIGGAPVTQQFADEIGADAYGGNAASAVDKCRELVGVTA